jgi:hypothetical protein
MTDLDPGWNVDRTQNTWFWVSLPAVVHLIEK